MNESENREREPQSTDFCILDYECAYLPDRAVRMSYKYITKATQSYNTKLIQRGWRRFGYYYFHPVLEL